MWISPVRAAAMTFWSYMWMMTPAVLAGLVLGGLIDYALPSNVIQFFLARKKKRTLLYAISLGFVLSACSHGILAIAIQLYKKGASIAAVVALLCAAPWANLSITILLWRFFGLKAAAVVASALVIALIVGWLFMLLDSANLLDTHPHNGPAPTAPNWAGIRDKFSSWTSIWTGMRHSISSLAHMIVWWFIIGAALASFMRHGLPDALITHHFGPTPVGLGLTLGLASLIEICSEGSAPMAFELYHQTGAFGNAVVFLMAGVATDYTEIGLLWSNVGWRSAIVLPIVSIPLIVGVGWWFNHLFT